MSGIIAMVRTHLSPNRDEGDEGDLGPSLEEA